MPCEMLINLIVPWDGLFLPIGLVHIDVMSATGTQQDTIGGGKTFEQILSFHIKASSIVL